MENLGKRSKRYDRFNEASPVCRDKIDDYGSRSKSNREAALVEGGVSQNSSIGELIDNEGVQLHAGTPFRFYLLILSLGVANSSFSTTTLLVSYLLADGDFNATIVRGSTAWRGGLLASAYFGGMLIGGMFIGGTICDQVGRKPILRVALAVGTIANILTAVSPDVTSLSLARFVAGVAAGATEPPLYTLAAEVSPTRCRGLLVTIVASFWMIGNIYVAVAGLIIFQELKWSWRSYVAVCAFPNLLAFVMVSAYVHESPRFLSVVRGHNLEAALIASEMKEVAEDIKDMSRATHDTVYSKYTTVVDTLKSAVQTIPLLYRDGLGSGITMPLQVIWFSLCFGSYCVLTWINALFTVVKLDDIYLNALIFALANLPGNIISFLTIDSAGRMPTLICSLVMSALSLVTFAWYAYQSSVGNIVAAGIVASACVFQALQTSAWNSLDVLTSEMFPTRIRSTGIGLCTASGRMGALVAQFVSGALINRPVALLLVASISFVVAAIVPCELEHGEMSRVPLRDFVTGDDN